MGWARWFDRFTEPDIPSARWAVLEAERKAQLKKHAEHMSQRNILIRRILEAISNGEKSASIWGIDLPVLSEFVRDGYRVQGSRIITWE